MKSYIVAIIVLFSVFALNAQNNVGIGTVNPRGILHVDGNKDTGTVTSDGTTTADDVVVTSSGALGIGLIVPTSGIKLEVGRTANPKNVRFNNNSEVTGNLTVSGSNSFTSDHLKYGNTLSTPARARLEIEASTKGAGLRLNNGTGNISNSNVIPVLQVDAQDNARWVDLPTLSNVQKGSVTPYTEVLRSSSANDITTNAITIPPGGGLWLVYARVTLGTRGAESGTSYGTGRRLIYMHLKAGTTNSASGTSRVESVAVMPETSGAHVGVLQIMYIYDAGTSASNQYLRLEISSAHYQSNSGTGSANENRRYMIFGANYGSGGQSYWNGYADPVFFAVRIDHKN